MKLTTVFPARDCCSWLLHYNVNYCTVFVSWRGQEL